MSVAVPNATLLRADPVRDAEWFLDYLKIDKAHSISMGAGVTVAITDTGIDPHEDFIHNIIPGIDLITGDIGQEKVDIDGHGTGMAGLIAAHGHGSGAGIIGIAPQSHLLPIKVAEASSLPSQLAAGIKFAATSGAQVINVSTGTSPSKELIDSIGLATKEDAVVVASSGNDFNASQIAYPAAIPGVLAVGAVDQNGNVASFSKSGQNLGICAPGTDIVTTGLNQKYSKTDGTSASTAIVSGAAALVRARFPGISARETIHRLTATATDIGPPGRDEQCGFGVLNIVKALTADVPPLDGEVSSGATGASSAAEPGDAGPGLKNGILGGIAAVLAGGVLVGFLVVRRRGRKPV
ncbi:S8 family serine peptidase [Actinoplanes sp. L3-i22]|uniref:S8 family serine peptidase n=1 Tax=Actinoplanes sp. L3-i22 TaxID=2836373 RepID=UPI001C853B3B|nr:S8 family serine peptidase [Actinoplanes sp. L3-i22]